MHNSVLLPSLVCRVRFAHTTNQTAQQENGYRHSLAFANARSRQEVGN